MTRTRVQSPDSRITQGDIFRDVEHVEYVDEKNGAFEISKIVFPLVVVLTQDCDLEQDERFRTPDAKSQDKLLISVLVAPIYNAEHVYEGSHLRDLNRKMQQIASTATQGKTLRQNEIPRYHHLEFSDDVPIVPSVVDFKHYFSVHLRYLRRVAGQRVCTIDGLFREHLSHRFSYYLARIGLPE